MGFKQFQTRFKHFETPLTLRRFKWGKCVYGVWNAWLNLFSDSTSSSVHVLWSSEYLQNACQCDINQVPETALMRPSAFVLLCIALFYTVNISENLDRANDYLHNMLSLFPEWYFQQRLKNSKFSFKCLNNTDISLAWMFVKASKPKHVSFLANEQSSSGRCPWFIF